MEESFNVVAKSRVNYFTDGSPVQFVRVELLRGDVSGDNAVCLSFKNIRDDVLTGLKVRFKCKGSDGTVLSEDDFTYDDLEVQNGELFGMDDAVFITPEAVGSVDVSLLRASYGRKNENLADYQRVRIPAPKKLPKEVAEQLQAQSGRKEMKYMPQVLENGWYCACGAFHPKDENTVYCSECGSDRILLQNAITSILRPQESVTATETSGEEPTQVMAEHKTPVQQSSATATRVMEQPEKKNYAGEPVSYAQHKDHTKQETEEYVDPRDRIAEALIRWVPAATALVCALIATGGFVYCKLFLR